MRAAAEPASRVIVDSRWSARWTGRVDRVGWHGSQRHEERRHAFGQRAEHVGDDAGLAGAARTDQRNWLSPPHGGVEPSLRLARLS